MMISLPKDIQKIINSIACRSNHPRFKHAAIIYDFKKKRIVSTGYNYFVEKGVSIHAEEMAIKKLMFKKDEDFSTKILIVARVRHLGYSMSKPCLVCKTLIEKVRFPIVLYTTANTVLNDLKIRV